MLKRMLGPIVICAVLLSLSCALAEEDQCLPWYDITWTEGESSESISTTIYVGVYECSGSLDLTGWPHQVKGTLVPLDGSWADALWQKVINDCWSFYGVYPEQTTDEAAGEKCVFALPSGSVTVEREQDDMCIVILAAHEGE